MIASSASNCNTKKYFPHFIFIFQAKAKTRPARALFLMKNQIDHLHTLIIVKFRLDKNLTKTKIHSNHQLCRDCIYPVNIRETRIRLCVEAAAEWYFSMDDYKYNGHLLRFYECMIALNVETTDKAFEKKDVTRSGKSFSRDYEMLTIEICFLG